MRHALLAGLALALLAAPSQAAPRIWDQTWNVGRAADVHIKTDDARVRIHAGRRGRVSAHVEYEIKRWGLLFGSSQPGVIFEHKGDEVSITLHDPTCIGVMGGVDERFTVDVTVPPDVQLAVRTGDGSTDCEPMTGRFTFESGDGAIRAHGLRGEVEVASGDGRVVLEDLDGRLRARTQDGHLVATGRFDSLDLSTGDGRVDASVQAGSRLDSSWSVETGDGAVSLKIPHDLSAMLDARTRDGHINVQLPISLEGRVARRQLVGELNGGGPSFRIRTSDGSITLALSD
jgi:hypothetical protein